MGEQEGCSLFDFDFSGSNPGHVFCGATVPLFPVKKYVVMMIEVSFEHSVNHFHMHT